MIIKMFSRHHYATKARENSLACEVNKEFCLACVEDVMTEVYMEGKKEGCRVEKYKTYKSMLERQFLSTPGKRKKFEKGYKKFCKAVDIAIKKEESKYG